MSQCFLSSSSSSFSLVFFLRARYDGDWTWRVNRGTEGKNIYWQEVEIFVLYHNCHNEDFVSLKHSFLSISNPRKLLYSL